MIDLQASADRLGSELVAAAGMSRALAASRGHLGFAIALLDGVITTSHPCFAGARIEQAVPLGYDPGRAACAHATFIASMLVGRLGDVLGLCRECTLLSFPIADRAFEQGSVPAAAAGMRLAQAVRAAVERGADLIQISAAFDPERSRSFNVLAGAVAAAVRRGVYTVIAAGNDAALASSPVLSAPGVIPVALAAAGGSPYSAGPLTATLGSRGIRAPGMDIPGAASPDLYTVASGSSYAAAFVTAALAQLFTAFPAEPREQIVEHLLRRRVRSIVPPQLNVDATFEHLLQHKRNSL